MSKIRTSKGQNVKSIFRMIRTSLVIGNFRFRYRFRPKFRFRYAFRFRFRYHSIFRFRPKFRFKIEPKTEIWTYYYHWFSAKKKMFFNLKKLKENIIFQTFSNCELGYQTYNLLISLISLLSSLISLSNYKTVSCLTNKMRQEILLKCSLSFCFVFRLSVSVSVSVCSIFRFRFRFRFRPNRNFGISVSVQIHVSVDH